MLKERTSVFVDGKSFEEMIKFFKDDPERFERWRAGVLLREFLKLPPSRRKRRREIFEKYVLKKTTEEWIDLLKNNPELFKEWRQYFLRSEILKSHLLKQIRLCGILNGLEIRMSRYGEGMARYNAMVGEFFDTHLLAFHAVLQGDITPQQEVTDGVIIPLFGDNNKSDT